MKYIVLLTLLCSACVTANRELPVGPEHYREGYRHGCDSARDFGGNRGYMWRYDSMREKLSPEYRDGWQRGFDECRAKYPTGIG